MTDSKVPEDLRYTAEHEWIEKIGPTTVRVGITDFAQDALGDVVFVQLPDSGAEVAVGESFAEVESTKSVSDIFGPLTGTVSAVNDALDASPELVNSDPYGEGWLVEIEAADEATLEEQLGDVLDAAGYRAVIEG
ncbi:glycine cleavage system H protein [Gordonia namibiensis NBRC 108229]|uniref:Glycine cleavage system H protein n=1 Tax=Gordonia namibiensis NBRC 108229 TaxID=1208314 RepID=K6VRB2_9ACTN|nr:glycine cleavage system protein GcvH [Gordonia namibiensis]GAB98753.1 glycine cleavage system H protein [Gordonia namibiensis NBRC 108229]